MPLGGLIKVSGMALGEKLGRNLRQLMAAAFESPEARRRVRRRYLFDALRYLVPYVAVDTNEGFMVLSTKDRTISKAIFVAGQWQDGTLATASRLVSEITGRSPWDGVFVEVGANIGTTTLPVAQKVQRAVVFEPSGENRRLLLATLAANGLAGRVDVVPAAASDRTGNAFLELSTLNSGEHRVVDHGTERIEIVRLDDALAERRVRGPDIGLLWVDAEGHEAKVLSGAPNVLAAGPPTVIELWPWGLGQNGCEQLLGVVDRAFDTVIDLATGQKSDLRDLVAVYRHTSTDVLLLRLG